jgi:hypothetical protein
VELELPGRDVPGHDPRAQLGQLEREASRTCAGIEHAVTCVHELPQEAAMHLEADTVHRPGVETLPLPLTVLVVEAGDERGVVRDLGHSGIMAPVLRRTRFAEVISRQLELFQREEADLIRQCDEAERAYDAADRDEAEEPYGDYVDLVETGTEALAELRWTYAATLDEDTAEAYEEEFNRAVKKRLPRFGSEIDLR